MSNSTVVTVDGWPVLNPLSPSAFLPPDTAYQQDVAKYVAVGTLGVYVWDILNNIQKDYFFIARHARVRFPTIIYFLSRLASFGFVLSSAIFLSAPTSNCFHFAKGLAVLFAIGMPSTSLLFFFRARAVFNKNVFAVISFGILWLAVLGGCLTTIPGLTGVNIGPTRYCVIGGIKPYSAAGAITPLINDTIVFFAVSWRLWRNSWARRTLKNNVRIMVFGEYLPSFSRSMLQDGQVYFLTSVTANILTVSMLYGSLLPPYRTMFTICNTALMNIMACRIYRETLMTAPPADQISSHHSSSNPNFNPHTAAPISLSLVGKSSTRTKEGGRPTKENLKVNLTKTVEYSMA